MEGGRSIPSSLCVLYLFMREFCLLSALWPKCCAQWGAAVAEERESGKGIGRGGGRLYHVINDDIRKFVYGCNSRIDVWQLPQFDFDSMWHRHSLVLQSRS